MKHRLLFLLSIFILNNMVLAQEFETEQPLADSSDQASVYPSNFVGVRGGINTSDMLYSYSPINQYYRHHLQPQGMVGLFGHFHLGNTDFAIRPEIAFVGRADSLEWLDVRYRLKVHYLDFRLPITYNIRFRNRNISPYLMLTPQLNLAYGGRGSYYAEDYPKGVRADITTADINRYDIGLLFGAGVDFLISTNGIPLLLSLEAGYNLGLCNNFSQREILNNPDVSNNDRSVIANPFHGAELYQGTRKNRGVELALRIALPIDDNWRKPAPQIQPTADTVYMPDTVYIQLQDTLIQKQTDTAYVQLQDTTIQKQTDTVYVPEPCNSTEYIRKDCYSFGEMYAFIKLGVDISDKRICLFNINFDFDSYRLRRESYPHLHEVAMMMKAYPEMSIKVIGHTDSIGSDSYNLKLSSSRANAVVRYLQSKGIEETRMEAIGYGEAYPIDTNSTEEGRSHNRRVEIEVLNVGIRNTNSNDIQP